MGAVFSIVAGVLLIITGSIIAAVVVAKRKKMNTEEKDPAKHVSTFGYWPVITSFVGIGLGVLLTILGTVMAMRDAKRKRLLAERKAAEAKITVRAAVPPPPAVVVAPVAAAPVLPPAPPAAVTVDVRPPAAIIPAVQPVRPT